MWVPRVVRLKGTWLCLLSHLASPGILKLHLYKLTGSLRGFGTEMVVLDLYYGWGETGKEEDQIG